MIEFDDTLKLNSESDVEQKVIWPILTNPFPLGMGYAASEVLTKTSIRRIEIGKGASRKLYFPDYMIILGGLPVMVCEAKAPSEVDLARGLDETRMYAAVINSLFPSGINPCEWVLVSNGNQISICKWDTSQLHYSVKITQVNAGDRDYASLVAEISRDRLYKNSEKLLKLLYRHPLTIPLARIGGQSIRNEEVEPNTFGSNLALEFRHIFSPSTLEDRAYLVKNAYIKSKRRERYIEPIDRLIRQILTPGIRHVRPIDDTGIPREITGVLGRGRSLEHQILLLIGSVGSGKSTFVDYLVNVALGPDLINKTVWLRIDMNSAPLDVRLAHDWLLTEIISELKLSDQTIDYDDQRIIFRMYASEIGRLKKGPLSLLDENSEAYKTRLADEIIALQKNKETTAKAIARISCAEKGKLLIVVLDNCDKRNMEDQLLMFQLANWTQTQMNCLVVLPLRDVTYELHKNEPPLDTAQKDLVFRIEPPRFTDVLRGRFFLALQEMKGKGEQNTLEYTLPNGARVVYPASDQGLYLASILKSLFEYDNFLRNLLTGLSGRDVRLALEMFLEFCRSGHISESEIFRIRESKGDYTIPLPIITRVILRKNRRFYDGEKSYLKNLFQCDPADAKPDNFVRIAILRYLNNRRRNKGPSGLAGFHRTSDLLKCLVIHGHTLERIKIELVSMLSARCIVAEHLRTDSLNDEDLISITPTGAIHLEMLNNLAYLAACAEDTWYDDAAIADGIASRIGVDRHQQYSLKVALRNAEDLVRYLARRRPPLPVNLETLFADGVIEDLHDISEAEKEIESYNRELENSKKSGRIYLGNLPYDIKEEEIQNLFTQMGCSVRNIYISKPARGYAFVTILNPNKIEEAIATLRTCKIRGRKVNANFAENR